MGKKWVYKFIKIFSFLSLSIIIINYLVDPFAHYRISSWYKITSKKQREVTPGLAKNAVYETVVLGSSMAENFKPSYIDKTLKTKSLKLCMSAMTAHEMNSLLKVIISNNKNIKHIILALDLYALTGSKTRIRTNKAPLYLYDNNFITDIFYLLNKETLRFSFRMSTKQRGKKTNFDDMWYWGNYYTYSKDRVLKTFANIKFNASFVNHEYTRDIFIRNFNYNILSIIKENPNIKFSIFYPPYSYLTYKDMKNKKWLHEGFAFKKYLTHIKPSNLDIYDFQCVSKITQDLSNYRDITHYSPKINTFIIDSLRDKKYMQNNKNIDKCLKQIELSADKE